MKIKLRRGWYGQDMWGAFLEEVGIEEETSRLAYRKSTGGRNAGFGKWEDWQGEKEALAFLLGSAGEKVDDAGVLEALRGVFKLLPDLEALDLTKIGVWDRAKFIENYGTY